MVLILVEAFSRLRQIRYGGCGCGKWMGQARDLIDLLTWITELLLSLAKLIRPLQISKSETTQYVHYVTGSLVSVCLCFILRIE